MKLRSLHVPILHVAYLLSKLEKPAWLKLKKRARDPTHVVFFCRDTVYGSLLSDFQHRSKSNSCAWKISYFNGQLWKFFGCWRLRFKKMSFPPDFTQKQQVLRVHSEPSAEGRGTSKSGCLKRNIWSISTLEQQPKSQICRRLKRWSLARLLPQDGRQYVFWVLASSPFRAMRRDILNVRFELGVADLWRFGKPLPIQTVSPAQFPFFPLRFVTVLLAPRTV